MKILVTGGAGYIGSHVVKNLLNIEYDIVIYDNLSTGYKESVLGGEMIVGDLSDKKALSKLFKMHKFDTVMHFAAYTKVSESVENPLKYYSNNTCNMINLLIECEKHNVSNFIFSSSAAVYGMPKSGIADEQEELNPINPYGASKMMSERMLIDFSNASNLNYAILRYFNVAGADPECRIGQAAPDATLLIKVACQTAAGLYDEISIFGTDYDTPDGTCIRDYIHVEDIASAHVNSLEYLISNKKSIILNCGYGHGYSVLDILNMVKEVTEVNFSIKEAKRRLGDPPILIADNKLIKKTLNWQPNYDKLYDIIKTAWQWELKLLYNKQPH
jgi:UDP-glucose 4-epimerase